MSHQFGTTSRQTSDIARAMKEEEYILIPFEKLSKGASKELILKSLETNGFLTVLVDDSFVRLNKTLQEACNTFFNLENELKDRINFRYINEQDYSNVGYYPFQTEKAQSHNLPDVKEFLHIGREPEPGSKYESMYSKIPWGDYFGLLPNTFQASYYKFVGIAEEIFWSIADSFDIDKQYSRALVEYGNSILRLIHYPPVATDSPAMRAAPHHGMNLIGVQSKSTHPGLQFCNLEGEWIYPDQWSDNMITVNIGRMFAFILNGRAKPTLHRVINNLDESNVHNRYTSVLFFHGNPLEKLNPLDGPEKLKPITVSDWTAKRLKDIKLK